MERTYDIFEVEPDGVVRWRCAVTGHDLAIKKLRELAENTKNAVRVMHIPTHSIVAVLNANGDTSQIKPADEPLKERNENSVQKTK